MGHKLKVLVCRGPNCGDLRHSSRIADEFHRLIGERGIQNVQMAWQSCFGRCTRGPNVLIRTLAAAEQGMGVGLATPPPASRGGRATMYNQVTPRDVAELVDEHLIGGRPLRRLMEHPNNRTEPNLKISNSGSTLSDTTEKKDGDS